jgi:cell division septation protein DedD
VEPDTTQIASDDTIGVPATGKYKIQVFASNSEAKANLTILDVKEINNYNAFYEKSGNLYKVFVGYFKLEQEARKALEDLRKNGFPDAWLVY